MQNGGQWPESGLITTVRWETINFLWEDASRPPRYFCALHRRSLHPQTVLPDHLLYLGCATSLRKTGVLVNVCIICNNMVMCCMNNFTRIDTMVFFQETHTFAATVLVKDFGADPLRKFESGECAILMQELGADLLPEYKGGECTITHAIRRGPTFVELSVELFVVLCTSRCPLAQRCGEQLVNEDVGDDTVS